MYLGVVALLLDSDDVLTSHAPPAPLQHAPPTLDPAAPCRRGELERLFRCELRVTPRVDPCPIQSLVFSLQAKENELDYEICEMAIRVLLLLRNESVVARDAIPREFPVAAAIAADFTLSEKQHRGRKTSQRWITLVQ